MTTPDDVLRFPGETEGYREARDILVRAEHDLSHATERVARLRRELPPGGQVPEDYQFAEGPTELDADTEQPVRLSELFGDHQTLLLYSFMFDGSRPVCRMCTSLIDGFDGIAADLATRVGFAVVAPAPLVELRTYARERHWRNVRLVSTLGTAYALDYGGQRPSGELRSRLNVFTRHDQTVRHFYATEKTPTDLGEDDRHLDLVWALWGALDLTPEGRTDWRPDRPPRR